MLEDEMKKLNDMADKIESPVDGDILVTPTVVCKSNAYYLGTWCLEYLDELGQWLPQPYSRDSGYFSTKEEAQAILNDYNN